MYFDDWNWNIGYRMIKTQLNTIFRFKVHLWYTQIWHSLYPLERYDRNGGWEDLRSDRTNLLDFTLHFIHKHIKQSLFICLSFSMHICDMTFWYDILVVSTECLAHGESRSSKCFIHFVALNSTFFCFLFLKWKKIFFYSIVSSES